MARTYRRANRGGHGSSKGARRTYNKLVRRTPEISDHGAYRRLVPWFCDELHYSSVVHGHKVKEGRGSWGNGWRYRRVDHGEDYDESAWEVDWYSPWGVYLTNRSTYSDERMIRRRRARKAKELAREDAGELL